MSRLPTVPIGMAIILTAATPLPSPGQPAPSPSSSPPAVATAPVPSLDQDNVLTAYDWMTILPAPATPVGYTPPAGARVQWPLRGVITQPFGCTGFELERPAADCPGGFHTGLDIAEQQGAVIRAAGPGLAYAFQDKDRYGNHVIIQQLGGISTLYAHMVRTAVAWGQPVRAGDVIGYVGSTGNSTGPHLHFEVRYAGTALDPMPYLDGSPPDPFAVPPGWPGSPPDDWRGPR